MGTQSDFRVKKNLIVGDGTISSDSGNLVLRRDFDDTTYNQITLGDDTYKITLDNSDRFYIDGNGNVGIGTTSPDAKLHVEGSIIVDSYNTKTTLATNYVDGETALVLADSSGFQNAGSGTIDGNAFTWTANNTGTNTLTVPDLDASYTAGGSLYVTPDAGIYFREGFESINQPSITTFDGSNSGQTPDGISINAYDDIRFVMGSSEKMRILTSGNVGIGTNSPYVALDVRDGDIGLGHLWTNGSVTTPVNIGKQDSTGGWSAGSAFMTFVDSNATSVNKGTSIYFSTHEYGGSTAERVRFAADGKVGIGTTNPLGNLVICNTGVINASLLFRTEDGNGGAADYSSYGIVSGWESGETNWTQSYLKFNHVDANDSYVNTMTMKGPDVGIGTTIPGFTLDVTGSFQAQGDHTGNVIIDNTGNNQAILASHTGAGNPVPWDIREDASADHNSANYAPLHITRMNMTADGAGSNIHFRTRVNGSNTPQEVGGFGATIDSGLTDVSTRTGSLHFYTTDAGTNRQEKMTIKSDGKVGIGVAAPSTKLHLKTDDDSNFPQLKIDNAGTGDAALFFTAGSVWSMGVDNSDSDKFKISQDNSNAYLHTNTRFAMTTAGNVGLGTASPGYALDIQRPDAKINLKDTTDTDDMLVRFEGSDGNEYGVVGYEGSTVFKIESPQGRVINLGGHANTKVGVTTADMTFTPTALLHVNGSFKATTKSFDIEHPTKEGMRLNHGVLEGPEHGVYIRGRLEGDTIELPDYWLGLVDEDTITVQLTAKGRSQNLYVKSVDREKVVVGGFTVESPDFYYFIQAERKDVDKMEVEYDSVH